MEKQKNIPKLRFPEFEGQWEKKKLGNTAELTSSKRVYLSDYTSSGIPFFRGKEITELKQGLEPTDILYISESAYLKFKKQYGVPEYDDILMTAVGTLGNVYRITDNKPFYFKDGNLIWLRKIQEHSSFLEILLFVNRKEVEKSSIGSTQRALTMVELRKLFFFFPTLPEQHKIASFFTAIDHKISQLKRKKTLLEQYKKGVMQKIFSQQIRFKDDNVNEFPKWEKMTGDALFETVSNKNHNSDLPILAITQEHGAIPRDMIDYYITVSEQSVESYKVVEKGDFIISLRSFQGGIEYSEYTGICSPAYIILRATQRIDHRYFKYYFKTDKYITDLNRKLEGIRDGKMISYKYFSEIEINVPSLPEQTKISNFLSAIDDKITHTQNQIEKAEVWKKGLMQQMFV